VRLTPEQLSTTSLINSISSGANSRPEYLWPILSDFIISPFTIANEDGDVQNFLSLSPSQFLKHLDVAFPDCE
jgi:hypothetical protein